MLSLLAGAGLLAVLSLAGRPGRADVVSGSEKGLQLCHEPYIEGVFFFFFFFGGGGGLGFRV